MSSIKLSKVQKSVLLQMRIGGFIMRDENNVYIFGKCISLPTLTALRKRKLIECSGVIIDGTGRVYKLTELGKTIKL